MRMHVLQHVPFEGFGAIGPWAVAKGFEITRSCFWLDEPLPSVDEVDWLVIMGGPMSVHDEGEFAWLAREKAFLREALAKGCAIIGVCLGAQLIAEALGGTVHKHTCKEIGWFPVSLAQPGATPAPFDVLPETFVAFHWHGETFDIPPGAIHAIKTDACANQAFVYRNNVVALQFHLECTEEGIAGMLEHCASELQPISFVQDAATIRAGFDYVPAMRQRLEALLDAMLRN